MKSQVTERLKEAPAQEVLDYLYAPELTADFKAGFPYLSAVNKAHVLMLAKQRIIGRSAARRILRAVAALERRGPQTVRLDPRLEDSYFNYEREIIAATGADTGGQMHTARSRNDLYAALTRLRARDLLLELLPAIFAARRTALHKAREFAGVVMSGTTHLQPSQPVTFGHYLMGVANALERDTRRIAAAYADTNLSPLGAAAMAGTGFPIDRRYTAQLLGFNGLLEHTQDAVASRDFALEILAGTAVFGLTCSRIAHDFYVWFAPEFGVVDFPDRVAGTSSIMPQKKNPVVLEHLKGKPASLLAALVRAAAAVKNTPFTNTIDANHESVFALWYAGEVAKACAALLNVTFGTVTPKPALMLERARGNFSTATDLADALVRDGGLSFRQAHHVVGAVVRDAIDRGLSSDRITLAMVNDASRTTLGVPTSLSEAAVRQALDPARSVHARRTPGGPAPAEVQRMAREAERRLSAEERAHDQRRDRVARASSELARRVKTFLSA